MTDIIVQHNDHDRNDVETARSFLWCQKLDPTLEARVEASGMAYMFLRRAERADAAEMELREIETSLLWTIESYAEDLDKVKQRAEKTAQRNRSLAGVVRARIATIKELETTVTTKEAELLQIGHALGVATRERALTEHERDQHARAITAWHLEAQRTQAETIKLAAVLKRIKDEATEDATFNHDRLMTILEAE